MRLLPRNWGVLRDVDWQIPIGASAVVGPNGSGKTTLLAAIEVVRHAMERDLVSAVDHNFASGANLRTWDVAPTDESSIRIDDGDATWQMVVPVEGRASWPSLRSCSSSGARW